MEPGITKWPAEQKKTAGSLEVEYCLTAEDYAAWSIHAWEKLIARQSRTLLARILRLIIWLAICLIAVLFAGIVVGVVREVWRSGTLTRNDLGILFGAFILLMLLLGLLRGVGPKSFARRLARRAAIRQIRLRTKQMPERNQQAVLTPDKVIERCSARCGKQETVLDWSLIDSIDLAEQHVFFITKYNQALIVPQRAFEGERDFLDFVETAWTFHRQAKENWPAAESANSSAPQQERTEERITTRLDDRIMS